MKKLFALLLTLTLLLSIVSCGDPTPPETPDTPTTTPVRVGYFPGTTGVGMAKLIADSPDGYTFNKYNGPDFITGAIKAGQIDIAAFPTNGVPNVYNNATDKGVKMLAINTLGVLHICTNGVEVNSIQDLVGKTVYYPEPAPKLILEYILKQNGIEPGTDVTLVKSTLDDLPASIISGTEVKIALLPEPKVTAAELQAKQAGKTDFKVSLNLTEEWDKISDKPLVQGCVMVSKSFAEAHPDAVNDFLKKYEESVNYIKDPANLDSAAQMVVDAGILGAVPAAKKAIPRSNITFIAGEDMVSTITSYFNALNISVPDSNFFYVSDSNE